MIDKDKVLPIARVLDVANVTPYISGWAVGMAEQRDADLVILKRDYVPRERVKGLVEACKTAAEALHQFHPSAYHISVGLGLCEWLPCKALREALALLDKEGTP